jgi:hypothetical protein
LFIHPRIYFHAFEFIERAHLRKVPGSSTGPYPTLLKKAGNEAFGENRSIKNGSNNDDARKKRFRKLPCHMEDAFAGSASIPSQAGGTRCSFDISASDAGSARCSFSKRTCHAGGTLGSFSIDSIPRRRYSLQLHKIIRQRKQMPLQFQQEALPYWQMVCRFGKSLGGDWRTKNKRRAE